MNSELVIPKWAWIGAVILFLLGIGLAVSPRDDSGRPILLLPDVKAVEDYRRSLASWHDRFRDLDGRIAQVLSGNYGDLFSQSSEGQKILNEAVQLLQEIDQTPVPPAAVPARDMIFGTGSAYLETARNMFVWISAPTPAHLDAERQALADAQAKISDLEASPWMATNP